MECSCSHFQIRGIFCEHSVCVAKFIYDARGETFDGFTHHDVAARYQTDVLYYAYKNFTPSNVQQMFHMLLCSDVNGPRLMSSQVMERGVGIKQLLASGTWRIGYLGAEVAHWTYQNNGGEH